MRHGIAPEIGPRAARLVVAVILIAAIAARAWALSIHGIVHPDEAFQYIEQAHRLVFGYGIAPWEYRYGMRSWLVPLLLAVPMKLGTQAGAAWPEPLLFARILVAVIAFAAVPAAWAIGRRTSRLHAAVAVAVIGLWYESVYFSVHVLTEVLATAAFLSGAAAIIAGRGRRGADLAAGALMALTVILRFHYGPAVAVFLVIALRLDRRRWTSIAIGALPMLAIGAIVDMAMGGMPFGWIVENFRQNIVRDRASGFGVAGPFAYFNHVWVQWNVAIVPILLFAGLGARRQPALAAAALVNLLIHMAIAHKEPRFIFLTTQVTLLLAALGSVDYARRALPRWSGGAIGTLTIGGWLAASLLLATVGRSAPDWRPNESGYLLASIAGRDPATCGIADQDISYGLVGGYAFVHRPVALYYPVWDKPGGGFGFSAAGAPAWNRLIARRDSPVPAGYAALACHGELCLYRRSGGCVENPAARATRLQTVLERNGD